MLTVVSAGYPFASVGPHAVGGAEQVLAALDEALVGRGERSIVVAPDGSHCRGSLRATPLPSGTLTEPVQREGRAAFARAIAACCARERPDVLHLHGTDAAAYLPAPADVPIILTLHLWPDRYPASLFAEAREDLHFVCVSDAQRAACPDSPACHTIHNGVDLRFFRPAGAPSSTVLLLGRICPEKAFHLAIDAARAARLPVVLAGVVYPYEAHQEYYEQEIRPRLGEDVRFVGPLNRQEKRRALASAGCVAIPSTIPETSSLVAMEALACGTPVVAFRTPALVELIDEGVTGWLVESPDEMPEALAGMRAFSRTRCREAAERHCGLAPMIDGYLDLYHALAPGFPPRAERVAWVR